MKGKIFVLLTMVVVMLSFFSVRASAVSMQVYFDVGIIDPDDTQDEPQRNPTIAPTVEIENYTLTFITPCEGLVLRLVNEDDEVEFTTIISGSTLVLPSYLSGDYQFEIISGNYIFYGNITL